MWEEIPERNRKILQMRKEGVRRSDVARKFNLSPSRIYLIEQQSRADKGTAERRVKLREQVVNADDLDALWAVEDLVDAIGVTVLTKKLLMKHFVEVAKKEISLGELMDMCIEAPVEGLENTSCQTPPAEYNQNHGTKPVKLCSANENVIWKHNE